MSTTKNYKLGKSTELSVVYNAEESTAVIKCNNSLYLNGLIYRQEKFLKDIMENGNKPPYITEMIINYDGDGKLLMRFPNLIGMLKFSNWLLTDNALKQVKTALVELKTEEGELKSPKDYEDLIDCMYEM